MGNGSPLSGVSGIGRELSAASAVKLRRALELCALAGALALADSPSYERPSTTHAGYDPTLAVIGFLLIAPWLVQRVRKSGRVLRAREPVDLECRRVVLWRTWLAFIACTCVFALAALARAPIHVIAPLALATLALATLLVWRMLVLSLRLAARDRARPIRALGWLAMTPCSLATGVLLFLISGDSWATLLLGSPCSVLGPILAGNEQTAQGLRRDRDGRV